MPRGIPRNKDDPSKKETAATRKREQQHQQQEQEEHQQQEQEEQTTTTTTTTTKLVVVEPPPPIPAALQAFEDDALQYSDIEFGERVAEGEYGEIFKGKLWGQQVALKLVKLQTKAGKDINVLKEFEDEVKVMKRLRHPNIVEYLGACIQQPNLCIVAEYCALGNVETYILENFVNKKKKVPLTLVLDLCIDAAAGLNWMHHKGYVHRDVKPSNLLLDENKRVKVADFGMTYLIGKVDVMNLGAAGTQWYMAPEVLLDEKYGVKCDVYSFAIVLCELLHGEHPFFYSEIPSATPEFTKVIVSGLRPKIPRSSPQVLVDLMEQCWVATPSERPTLDHCLVVLRKFRSQIENGGTITRMSRSRSQARSNGNNNIVKPTRKTRREEEEEEEDEEGDEGDQSSSASSCESGSESEYEAENDNKEKQLKKELSEERKKHLALQKSSTSKQKKIESLIKKQTLQIQQLQHALEAAEKSTATVSVKRKKISQRENGEEKEEENVKRIGAKGTRTSSRVKKPTKKPRRSAEESDYEEEVLKKSNKRTPKRR